MQDSVTEIGGPIKRSGRRIASFGGSVATRNIANEPGAPSPADSAAKLKGDFCRDRYLHKVHEMGKKDKREEPEKTGQNLESRRTDTGRIGIGCCTGRVHWFSVRPIFPREKPKPGEGDRNPDAECLCRKGTEGNSYQLIETVVFFDLSK
jgi:hypothetical protein